MGSTETTSWLSVEREGDRACVRTAEAYVRRKRRNVLLLAGGVAIFGAALAFVWPWAIVLVPIGATAAIAGPRRVRAAVLVTIDSGWLRSGATGTPVAIDAVREIFGEYEVHGWNPYSTVYADLVDGARMPLAVFTGADEALPEAACRAIGRLVGRPSSYTGQYGDPRRCEEEG